MLRDFIIPTVSITQMISITSYLSHIVLIQPSTSLYENILIKVIKVM